MRCGRVPSRGAVSRGTRAARNANSEALDRTHVLRVHLERAGNPALEPQRTPVRPREPARNPSIHPSRACVRYAHAYVMRGWMSCAPGLLAPVSYRQCASMRACALLVVESVCATALVSVRVCVGVRAWRAPCDLAARREAAANAMPCRHLHGGGARPNFLGRACGAADCHVHRDVRNDLALRDRERQRVHLRSPSARTAKSRRQP